MSEVNLENVTYGRKMVEGIYEKCYEKWIDLSGLSKHKNKIKWCDGVGCYLKFKYIDIEGELKITEYRKENQSLTVLYNGNVFNISTGNLCMCNLGKILNKVTKDFKVEIGQIFKDDKRNLVITDRRRNGSYKYYKYKCNKCGFDCGEHYKNGQTVTELWIVESDLITRNRGCSCCCNSPQITVPHINSIVARKETQWMIPYFQGGYDEAKMYTPSSGLKVYLKCPYCGEISKTSKNIDNLYNQKNIECLCKDGLSFSEKFLYSMLKQIGIDFVTQLNKTTFKWCDKYKYDFYIPSLNCIIEANGEQHYCKTFNYKDISIEQKNDRIKKELALNNNVGEYIVLDCRKSNSNWIKNNILSSTLNDLFDLSEIDWIKCEEFASNNLAKEVCEYWKNKHEYETTIDLMKKFELSRTTVIRYLKRGNRIGWCDYDARIEATKSGKGANKRIEIFKDNVSLGIFESITSLINKSEEMFNVKLDNSNISKSARNEGKTYKGFTFKYVDTNKEEIA